jgi:ribokinase
VTRVIVVGSVNVDLVATVDRLPAPGETVTGGRFAQHHGGKGGNQAVAAARALGGGPGVVIVGAVGNDVLGHDALDALRTEGVATSVAMRPGVRTGVALICVDPDGENQISVAPGANAELSAGNVTSAFAQVHEIAVVLASLEVSHGAVRAAAAWCSEHQVPFVLNPAPVQPWAVEVAALATYVTPNEHERGALGGLPESVIVVETRGPDGALIHRDGTEERVPAPGVQTVDTTGAGDCFNGVFAAGLAEGLEVAAAVQRATAAAALSVTKVGAREGMPTRQELDAFLQGTA